MTLRVEALVADGHGPRTLVVPPGSIAVIVGPNGSGKSAFLRCIAGEQRARGGEVWVGDVDFSAWPAHVRARRGLVFVSDGRDVFPSLTVREHFAVFGGHDDGAVTRALEVFPQLEGRDNQLAGTLSGGEQQMLALSRAVVRRTSALLADEPVAGLSPKASEDLYGALRALAASGAAVVVAEQDPARAARFADALVDFGD